MCKQNIYHVMAKLNLDVGVDIKAASLEDAVDVSKTLTISNFVTFEGKLMDSSLSIEGIFKNESSIHI